MDPTLREFYLREIASLEAEMQRIKDAQRLMRQATREVKAGRLDRLGHLGFSAEHARILTARHQNGEDIFLRSVQRGNRQMLHRMQKELAILRQHLG